MEIRTERIQLNTTGQGDLQDLTPALKERLERTGLQNGTVTLFVVGSTAGLSTIEFEPGLSRDLKEFWDALIPFGKKYHHHGTWGDDNGSSHLRATLQGPSLVVPFVDKELTLGTWQQVVLAEFDTRARSRVVIAQFMGI